MDAESCDHLGSRWAPGPFVIWSGAPPASRRIQICRDPVESLTNATDLPSGENAGLSSRPAKSVRRRNFTALTVCVLPQNHHAPTATAAMARNAISQRRGYGNRSFGKGSVMAALESETEDVD